MRDLDGKEICGSNIEVNDIHHLILGLCVTVSFQVSLAKPPSDKKKKEEVLRARERRMMQMIQTRSGIIG